MTNAIRAAAASSSIAAKTLETKDGEAGASDPNVKEALTKLLSTFEQFKQKNDERLDAIEKKSAADPLDEATVDRMNEAVDSSMQELKTELQRVEQKSEDARKQQMDAVTMQAEAINELKMAMARPDFVDVDGDGIDDREQRGSGRRATPEQKAHANALITYMRNGNDTGLRDLEEKALAIGSDPDGGYLAGFTMETAIDRVLSEVSPIRDISSVRQISNSSYKLPYNSGGAASGWVGETSSRGETDTPNIRLREYPVMELYANPFATQSMLDDGVVDIEAWLSDEVSIEFAEQEGRAFVNGDGVNRPRGLLSYPKVANVAWADGNLGFVNSGVANALSNADNNGVDAIIDLVYGLQSAYRQNARHVMNRTTQGAVRKLKDDDGQYLWQPSVQAGQPATLLGYGITEAEDMPSIEANSFPILFGDFQRTYVVVDRIGIRVLRDPYSSKPHVGFYTTKRVGGGVKNFESYKGLKIAA